MVASSVTGLSGPGDSKGKYKPENNCSCSCCCENNKNNNSEIKKNKKSCSVKYKTTSCGIIKNKSGFRLNIKIC
jgi:hypothetical protein